MFEYFGAFFARPLNDLGTANTPIYAKESGIVLNEPRWWLYACKAIKKASRPSDWTRKNVVGRFRNITAIRPLKDGRSGLPCNGKC